MNRDIQIRGIGPPQRDLLIAMYDRFDPLGAALGLPPRTAERRCEWIGNALGQKVNVAAFSPAGEVVGHCFLAADQSASAEMAVFVHQESRRIGVGTALLKAALDWGGEAGLRHVWSLTASENRVVLRLQKNCGFRLMKSVSIETELEIDLPVPWAGLARCRSLRIYHMAGRGKCSGDLRSGRTEELFLHTRSNGQDGVGNRRR